MQPFEPWNQNPYNWSTACGYTPPDPNIEVGGECESSDTCLSGSVGGCCTELVIGPCDLAVDCIPDVPITTSSTPTSSPTPTPTVTFLPAPIPSGWSVAAACVQDNINRVFENVLETELGCNTPECCIEYCAGFGYTFAGVEYTVECFCGTGFLPGTPENDTVDPAFCDMPCYGNHSYSCGGPWYIQLYQGPPAPLDLPDGWSVAVPCAVDSPSRVLANDNTTVLSDNTPGTCATLCQTQGYTYAGVEYTGECHCGTGYAGGVVPQSANTSDCNMPCNGNEGLTCGGQWRIQIYTSD